MSNFKRVLEVLESVHNVSANKNNINNLINKKNNKQVNKDEILNNDDTSEVDELAFEAWKAGKKGLEIPSKYKNNKIYLKHYEEGKKLKNN